MSAPDEVPPFESSKTQPDTRTRVLVVDDDATIQTVARASLERAGFLVEVGSDLRVLRQLIQEFRPTLVLIDEVVPPWSGREALLLLGPEGLGGARVVGLLDEGSATNELGWFRSGAVDLITKPLIVDLGERMKQLLEELDGGPRSLREAYLAWLLRERRDGTLVVHPETPFEGRATFRAGHFNNAGIGPLTGPPALDQMLSFDNASYRWDDPSTSKTQPLDTHVQRSYRPRLLVVEDEEDIRALLTRQLKTAGYEVEVAEDGLAGLRLGTSEVYDVIIADLAMPGLDGWGMLRRLQQDVVAREAAVLVLSAHDEMRDALKAARAGARAYLKKTGRAKFLTDAVQLLAGPRQEAWDLLKGGHSLKVDTRVLGPVWLIRALAENDSSGQLSLVDPLGQYELVVAQGQLLVASSHRGSEVLNGPRALEAIITARGEGRWTPLPTPAAMSEVSPWLFDAVELASGALARRGKATLQDEARAPQKLSVDPQLAVLFARVATGRDLEVLAAIREHSAESLDALSERLGMPIADVEEIVVELLRRGVVDVDLPMDEPS